MTDTEHNGPYERRTLTKNWIVCKAICYNWYILNRKNNIIYIINCTAAKIIHSVTIRCIIVLLSVTFLTNSSFPCFFVSVNKYFAIILTFNNEKVLH